MNPPLTRKALAACLNRLKGWRSNSDDVMKDKDFVYYHLNRNFFNNKYGANEAEGGKLTSLTQTGSRFSDTFIDNLGRKWTEASWMGIQYHQTPEEHKKDFWLSHREWVTRKFYSADEHMAAVGYGGCEFELVIRGGMRLVSGGHMETYNFGPYGIWSTVGYNGLHGKFDVKSHEANQKYETKYYPSNKVSIVL